MAIRSLRVPFILKFLSLVLLTILSSSTGLSQYLELPFEEYTVVDGLSQSYVNCMLEDKNGFMWFGTGDGLNEYDGYTFKIFRHSEMTSNSLSHSSVNALLQDQEGRIWIGTAEGLDIYDPKNKVFSHILVDCDVNAIQEDLNHILWIGSWKGLWEISPDGQIIRNYRHNFHDRNSLTTNAIRCIAIDSWGSIWIGTDGGGLNVLNVETGSFTYHFQEDSIRNSLCSNIVTSLLSDRRGSIWVGTSKGLNQYDETSRTWKRFVTYDIEKGNNYRNYILSLVEDSLGRIWAGTSTGLNICEPEKVNAYYHAMEPSSSNSSANQILAIQFGQDGTLWLGTKNGIEKYSRAKKKFITYRKNPSSTNTLLSNKVWAVYVDKSNILWIGTDEGLSQIDRNSNTYLHFRHDPTDPGSLSDNDVLSIVEDEKGQLWIGTWRSLDRLDRKTLRFTHFRINRIDWTDLSNSAMIIQKGKQGNLWIGAWNGVHCFDPGKQKYIDEPYLSKLFPNLTLGALYEDSEGCLWVGALGQGLLKYNSVQKTVTKFTPNPNDTTTLGSAFVYSIYESTRGKLWVGTTEGLQLMDKQSGQFRHFSKRQGLANNYVAGILEDSEGNLWLSTNGGLSRFDIRDTKFRNYDAADGLQSNEFNAWSAHYNYHGELFFGGINGLTSFVPESLKDNPHIPPVCLTSFMVFSQGQLPTRTITDYSSILMNYPENTFSFEFTALDYTIPKKNLYAYRLEGFDREWIYSGNRHFASYTNLDPGRYVLRIKGSNNDGLWNESGISIPLQILPPFWKTWWFRFVLITVLIFTLTVLYYLRLRSIKLRNVILEKRVGERTLELNETNENLRSQIESRKRIEKELKSYENQLEHKVREKTLELSNTVETLEREVVERKRIEHKLLEYQDHLRSLAAELSSTEERERNRIATHLHDYVGQALAMCKLKLDLLKEGRKPVQIDEVCSLLLQAIEHTRSLTVDLSPPAIRELSFADAMEWLSQQFQDKYGLNIYFRDDSVPKSLSDDLKTFLYHAVRELLTNVVKHAQSQTVEVTLQVVAGELVIKVVDDGVGFDPGKPYNRNENDSFGLFNIRERLPRYGGSFIIVSEPGNGTCATLTIPTRVL